MKKLITLILLLMPTLAQAGWVYIDMRLFWIPGPGEPQSPPLVPISGPNPAPVNPPPALNLPPLPAGWQYDPRWCPPPPSTAPSYSLTEAQANGIATVTNGIISMIGNHPPSPAEIEYYRVNSEITKQHQDQAALEEHTRRMVEEAKKAPVDTLPPTEDFVRKTLAEIAAEQKIRLSIDPDTISDPDESQLPYQLQAPEGPFRNELMKTYKNLHKIAPPGRKQQRSKEIGLLGVQEADQSFIEGDHEQAMFWKSLAEEALEIAIGLNPTTGFVQSMYELVVGKSIVTSDDLGTTQRAFAFLGVVTLGGAGSITVAGSVMNKVYRGAAGLLREGAAMEVAVREGRLLVQKAGNLIEGWQKGHKITHLETAAAANARLFARGYTNPPYKMESHLVHFKTTADQLFVRVHLNGPMSGEVGTWLIRKGEIVGLTPQQIANKLNLENIPTHVTDVLVPGNTFISRGMTHLNHWGTEIVHTLEGQVQYRVESPLSVEWYRNTREIGALFR